MYDVNAEQQLQALRYGLGIQRVTGVNLPYKGAYVPATRCIAIEDKLSPNEAISVEIHELAHALTHLGGFLPEGEPTETQRAVAERIAHGAAEIVCPRCGVDYHEEATTTNPPYPHYQRLACLTGAEQRVARIIAEVMLAILDRPLDTVLNEEWGYARSRAIEALGDGGPFLRGES